MARLDAFPRERSLALFVSMKEGGLSRSRRGQIPLTFLADRRGERRRVKRLSKLTGVNVGWPMALDAAA